MNFFLKKNEIKFRVICQFYNNSPIHWKNTKNGKYRQWIIPILNFVAPRGDFASKFLCASSSLTKNNQYFWKRVEFNKRRGNRINAQSFTDAENINASIRIRLQFVKVLSVRSNNKWMINFGHTNSFKCFSWLLITRCANLMLRFFNTLLGA